MIDYEILRKWTATKARPTAKEIETPPHCYEGGKIKAHFGEYTYSQIYEITHCPLVVKKDGDKQVACSECHVNYFPPEKWRYKRFVCDYCRKNGGLTYIQWANVNAIGRDEYPAIFAQIGRWGLTYLTDHSTYLGYDPYKQALIFPLNSFQYIEVPFDETGYKNPKEALKVFGHYNIALEMDASGRVKEKWLNGKDDMKMPYLDNRFYSVDGETIIAGSAKLVECGTCIYPFDVSE